MAGDAQPTPNWQLCHGLLLWLIPQLDKFPRVRRFTLGERIEGGLLAVLELVVEAAYTRNKEAPLRRAALSPRPSITWYRLLVE